MTLCKGGVIIPARFESSRFPGKPLADILGKTMIQRVYEQCVSAVEKKNVYVATDDDRIEENVLSFGGQVIRTSSSCMTGTDRLAEANESLSLDFVVNVQGDEPLINPRDILEVYSLMEHDQSTVINCYSDLSIEEREIPSVPKVVISKSNRLLYMSRGGIPFNKKGFSNAMFKQVCIYGFSRAHLQAFAQCSAKYFNEDIEDIEILRFLEMDLTIKMIKVKSGSMAVDTLHDLERVKTVLAGKLSL